MDNPEPFAERRRPSAAALLRDLGTGPRLTIYLACAPGAGKTRRLLEEALRLQESGIRVAIGWIETKGRPELDALAARLPRLPLRPARVGTVDVEAFDFHAALAARPALVVLDELAHTNLPGGAHAKRWEDAAALRRAGIGVIGALNVHHIETIAGIAERLIGFPVREIVPLAFLRDADAVIALDVAPEQVEARVRGGGVVRAEDAERALAGGVFRLTTQRMLRELMLRLVDDLAGMTREPRKRACVSALVSTEEDLSAYIARAAAFARALDLRLELVRCEEVDPDAFDRAALAARVRVARDVCIDVRRPNLAEIPGRIVCIPLGTAAQTLVSRPAVRDIFIIDASDRSRHPDDGGTPLAQALGDRLRIGYGKLTIYLGGAAGCGKTYAMLDRAHQLRDAGTDVLAGFIETHGRAATEAKAAGIPALPRLADGEIDLHELLRRAPAVALIDELAHTNASGNRRAKRYDDVLTLLRASISVLTTLNVQHLEGLNDTVFDLTGTRVRETLPDAFLELADDVILVDTTPETLRERLRAGKIYPAERIEQALGNFFCTDNLAALREIALREVVRVRGERSAALAPRLLLGVQAREGDLALIARCGRIAARLHADLTVVHIERRKSPSARTLDALAEAALRVRARWLCIPDTDVVRGLLRVARDEEARTIALEGARRTLRFGRKHPLARRLLEASARQLLVLAPRGEERY